MEVVGHNTLQPVPTPLTYLVLLPIPQPPSFPPLLPPFTLLLPPAASGPLHPPKYLAPPVPPPSLYLCSSASGLHPRCSLEALSMAPVHPTAAARSQHWLQSCSVAAYSVLQAAAWTELVAWSKGKGEMQWGGRRGPAGRPC